MRLDPGGYRVFVRGTLSFGAGASISRDGNDATSGGAALGSGTPGGSVTNSLGGAGGAFSGSVAGSATPRAPRSVADRRSRPRSRRSRGRRGRGVVAVVTTSAQPAGLTLDANGGVTPNCGGCGSGGAGRTVWLN